MMRAPTGLMPIDGAAVSLPRSAARYRPVVPFPQEDHDQRREREHDEREHEERLVARHAVARQAGVEVEAEELRSLDRETGRSAVQTVREDPEPIEVVQEVVRRQCRGEGEQGEVDAAEPDRHDRDQRAEHPGDTGTDEHRHGDRRPPLVGELGRGVPTEPGERRLRGRHLPAQAGDHRDRQQHHGDDETVRDAEHPEVGEPEEHRTEQREEEHREHDPVRAAEALVVIRDRQAGRWWVDALQRVAGLAAVPDPEDEQQEQHHERQRRAQSLRQHRGGVERSGQCRLQHAEPDRSEQRERQAHEPAERGGGDRHHEQGREAVGVDRAVQRPEQHAGDAGHEARQHPCRHADSLRSRRRRAPPCGGSPRPRASGARAR